MYSLYWRPHWYVALRAMQAWLGAYPSCLISMWVQSDGRRLFRSYTRSIFASSWHVMRAFLLCERYMYVPILILVIGAALSLLGCSDPTQPSPVTPHNSFERGLVTMTADTDVVIVGRPTTITTRVVPLLTGKGRIEFRWSNNLKTSGLIVFAPFIDTLPHADDSVDWVLTFPVTFTANTPLETRWTFAFTKSAPYGCGASAFMDSIFVADSMRYFARESDIARRQDPDSLGYQCCASQGSGGLIFLPPH